MLTQHSERQRLAEHRQCLGDRLRLLSAVAEALDSTRNGQSPLGDSSCTSTAPWVKNQSLSSSAGLEGCS